MRLTQREEDAVYEAFSDALSTATVLDDIDGAIEKARALPLFLEQVKAAHEARFHQAPLAAGGCAA